MLLNNSFYIKATTCYPQYLYHCFAYAAGYKKPTHSQYPCYTLQFRCKVTSVVKYLHILLASDMKQRYKGCNALCNYVLCILTISLFILCTRFSPTGANQKIDRLKKITKHHHFLQIFLCIYNAKQKHLGCKKLRGQSEAAIKWLYMRPKCVISG